MQKSNKIILGLILLVLSTTVAAMAWTKPHAIHIRAGLMGMTLGLLTVAVPVCLLAYIRERRRSKMQGDSVQPKQRAALGWLLLTSGCLGNAVIQVISPKAEGLGSGSVIKTVISLISIALLLVSIPYLKTARLAKVGKE